MTMRLSVAVGASRGVFLTLVVSYGAHEQCEEHRPHAHPIVYCGEEAAAVELCDQMRDFGIGRRRREARVDGHGEAAELSQRVVRMKRESREGEIGGTAQEN